MEQGIGEEKRMRRGSTGDIEELLKRKRERMEKEKEEAELEEEIFKRSKVMSPSDKGKQESMTVEGVVGEVMKGRKKVWKSG